MSDSELAHIYCCLYPCVASRLYCTFLLYFVKRLDAVLTSLFALFISFVWFKFDVRNLRF